MSPWWDPFGLFSRRESMTLDAAPAPTGGELRVLAAGFNHIVPEFWGGSDGALSGCENDARDAIAACTTARDRTLLTGLGIGPQEFRQELRQLAARTHAGDRVVIWFSGHGGTDFPGDPGEPSSEFLVLPRGPLPEWDLQQDLLAFPPLSDVLIAMDACHSLGMTRGAALASNPGHRRPKALPHDVLRWASDHYESLFAAARARRASRSEMIRSGPEPNVVAVAACGEKQVAYDGERNGAFSERFFDVHRRAPTAAWGAGFQAGPAQLRDQTPGFTFVTPGGERVWKSRMFA